MPTLLLRLAAPLQSWGGDCKFEIRRTRNEPTKSGVIGMLAAALGWRRDDDEGLLKLNTLKFGVRVDQEGMDIVDFHTAHGKDSYVTYRHYLSDAIFLAGLENDNKDFLKKLEDAIKNPVFPLFLGRRSCPPTLPIVIGIRDCTLENALTEEPVLGKISNQSIRVQLEATDTMDLTEASVCHDLALSFNPQKRIYGYRKVKEHYMDMTPVVDTEHDAMSELEEL